VPSLHISPVYAIVSELIVLPVSFRNSAPKSGTRLALRTAPKARSLLPVEPKLYVSPTFELPVPAVYCVLALLPDSERAQPVGRLLLLALLSRLLKS
jgi:hypothetical protein